MADTITNIENLLLGFTNSLTNASVGLNKEFKTRPELQELPFEYHIPKMSIEIGVNLTTTKGKIKSIIFFKKESSEEETINTKINLDIVATPPRNRPAIIHNEANNEKTGKRKEGIFAIRHQSGKYMNAENGGSSGAIFLNKEANQVSLDEHFTVYRLPDSTVVFQTRNGNYLTVNEEGHQPNFFEVKALPLKAGKEIGPQQKFVIEPLNNGEPGVGLKSVFSERYIRVGDQRKNPQLYADKMPFTRDDVFFITDNES
ncbi:MAG TPA: hypothetical protein DCS93_41580 [Microscillaceae bacterium]|nr:hypothetical protein [Microscillaceae bacterium]